MLAGQQGLGLAIPELLAQVGGGRRSPVMPDKPGRAEPDPVSLSLQPPTQIHIVSGRPEHRVESSDFLQCHAMECHVAPRHMFRLTVSQHHVGRPPGRRHNRGRKSRILWGQIIWAADPGIAGRQQIAHQITQPILVRSAIGVGKRDHLADRPRDSRIPRHGQPLMLLVYVSDGVEFRGDICRPIRGTIVDQEDFIVRVIQVHERFQAHRQGPFAVVAGYHHRNLREPRRFERPGPLERRLNRVVRRLGFPFLPRQTKSPILDRLPSPVPLVRKPENHRAAESQAERDLGLPPDQIGLSQLPMAQTVRPILTQYQRLTLGVQLQARQVRSKALRS